MYGYTLATYRSGTHQGMNMYNYMLAHPPFDTNLTTPFGDAFYILHLTYPLRYTKYGNITEDESQVIWKFDKRVYMDSPPPRGLADPPEIVTNQLVRLVIKMVNEATENIPCWDDYVQHKLVTMQCTASRPATAVTTVALGDLASVVHKTVV